MAVGRVTSSRWSDAVGGHRRHGLGARRSGARTARSVTIGFSGQTRAGPRGEQALLRPRRREAAIVSTRDVRPREALAEPPPARGARCALRARGRAGRSPPTTGRSTENAGRDRGRGGRRRHRAGQGGHAGRPRPAIPALAGRRALETGAVLAEGTQDGGFHLARVSSRWALALCRPASLERTLAHAEEAAAGGDAMATDVTSLYAGFALSGPRLPACCRASPRSTWVGCDEGACAATRVAEIPAVLVRPGRRGRRSRSTCARSTDATHGRRCWVGAGPRRSPGRLGRASCPRVAVSARSATSGPGGCGAVTTSRSTTTS